MDPVILERARALSARYRIVLEPEEELGYVGHPLEMPGVMDDGQTPDECVAKVREAIATTVGMMLEQGQAPPPPANGEKRTAQINVRVTEEEKAQFEAAARRDGFRGVSDFLRAAGLTLVR